MRLKEILNFHFLVMTGFCVIAYVFWPSLVNILNALGTHFFGDQTMQNLNQRNLIFALILSLFFFIIHLAKYVLSVKKFRKDYQIERQLMSGEETKQLTQTVAIRFLIYLAGVAVLLIQIKNSSNIFEEQKFFNSLAPLIFCYFIPGAIFDLLKFLPLIKSN